LKEINPELIYCSISGYGQDGPNRDLPGHDPNYLSQAGVLSLAGDPEGPASSFVGASMADLAAAWFSTIAILGALRAHDRHGVGQYIDVALADASYALVQNRMTEFLVNGGLSKSSLMSRPAIGLFEAKDGKSLTVAAIEQHFWEALCRVIGMQDWLNDPTLQSVILRRSHGERIRVRLQEEFLTKDRDVWLDLFHEAGVPCAPVNDLGEAAHDENATARHIMQNIEHPTLGTVPVVRFPPVMSRTPATTRRRPPLLSEHTDSILAELGYSELEMFELHERGVV
jgi:crotonobetainyl-CoA:carnitine CoA-transferase CaiB-like acyl-CoA transferase